MRRSSSCSSLKAKFTWGSLVERLDERRRGWHAAVGRTHVTLCTQVYAESASLARWPRRWASGTCGAGSPPSSAGPAPGTALVITIGGRPVAQLGPIETDGADVTLDDLVARGLVEPARRGDRPPPSTQIDSWTGNRLDRILREVRGA